MQHPAAIVNRANISERRVVPVRQPRRDQDGDAATSSPIAQLTRDIVVAFLARPNAAADSSADLEDVISTTYKTLRTHEAEVFKRTGRILSEATPVSDTALDPAEDNLGQPVTNLAETIPSRSPTQISLPEQPRPAPQDSGPISLPDTSLLDMSDNEKPKQPWDAEAWLANFTNPSKWMIEEAHADNPYMKEHGWVGVYDQHIVCLLTGRKLAIITQHLRKTFAEKEPALSTPEGYRQTLRLPADYPKAAPYLSNVRSTIAANQDRRINSSRDPEMQAKIENLIAKAGLDGSKREQPSSRPGTFPDFMICLECGQTMHDLRKHVNAEHSISYDHYKRKWRISGRAHYAAEQGMTLADAKMEARRFIEELGLDPDTEVNPGRWPGVLPQSIICLLDGQPTDNLPSYLSRIGYGPLSHYLARFELPADYPLTIGEPPAPETGTDAGTKTGGKAPRKRRTARPAEKAAPKAKVTNVAPPLPAGQPAGEGQPFTANEDHTENLTDNSADLEGYSSKLAREAAEFKQRKASGQTAAPAPRSLPTGSNDTSAQVHVLPSRRTREERVIEGKIGAQKVVVERKPGKLRLKN